MNVDGIEAWCTFLNFLERVNNPGDYVKIGEAVKAKIIAIDKTAFHFDEAAVADPWIKEVEKSPKATKLRFWTRITPFVLSFRLAQLSKLGSRDELGGGEGAT